MVEDYEEMCRQVQDFFDLRRKPVAVRLLKEPVAPDAPGKEYCALVQEASLGEKRFVITAENAGSTETLTVLGLAEPEHKMEPRMPVGTRAVVIEPLDLATGEPDVVLLIGTPARIMDVIYSISWVRAESCSP